MDRTKPDQKAGQPQAAVARDVSLDEAEKLLKSSPPVEVLDVRTPEEFKDGHLAGARNIDIKDAGFTSQVSALDRSKPYLVHCAMGGRSAKAMEAMKGLGFTTLYHMHEGMKGWLKSGRTIQRGT
jgi:phage shock protein E